MRPLMRIHPQLINELFEKTDPIEAVGNLSNLWSPRVDASLSRLGLSVAEYNVELTLIYEGEVFNGAHYQYFINRGTVYCKDTIEALRMIGLVEYSEILAEASSNLPTNLNYIDNPTKLMMKKWSEADDAFHLIQMRNPAEFCSSRIMMEYLRKNIEDVLIEERGL